MRHRSKGMHLILDLRATDCLSDKKHVCKIVRRLAILTDLHLGSMISKSFPNGSEFGPGITVLGILSKSNIAIHTSPDCGIVNVDIYSCEKFDTDLAQDYVMKAFGAQEVLLKQKIQRY